MEEKTIRSQAGRPMSYGYMLWALDDNTLYTAATIADLYLERDLEPHEHDKLKAALRMIANRHFFHERVDGAIRVRGRVFNAWLGRTWKLIVPPEDRHRDYDPNLLFQVEGRQLDPEGGYLRALAEGAVAAIDEHTPLIGDLPVTHVWSLPADGEVPAQLLDFETTPTATPNFSRCEEEREKSHVPPVSLETVGVQGAFLESNVPAVIQGQAAGPSRRLRYGSVYGRLLAAACALLLCAAWLVGSQPVVPVADARFRIAYLSCPEQKMDALVAEMVSVSFSNTSTFQPIAVDSRPAQLTQLCGEAQKETLAATAQDLAADFLIWGETKGSDGDYTWDGFLYRPNGGQIKLRAAAPTILLLTENIIRTTLDRSGEGEKAVAATGIFSLDSNANLLYSEGMLQFRTGNINGALPFFQRSGGAYDPNFFLARRQWAYCLMVKGDLERAQTIYEDLLARRAELSPYVLGRVYKDLARLYNSRGQRDKFQDLMPQAKAFVANSDPLTMVRLLTQESVFLVGAGKQGEAKRAAADAAALAHQCNDPEAKIDSYWAEGRFHLGQNHLDQAGASFDQALNLAQRHHYYEKLVDIYSYKVRIYLSAGNHAGAERALKAMRELSDKAALDGNHLNRLAADYWLARGIAYSGKPEIAWSQMRVIAREAGDYGLLDLELQANAFCIDYLLGHKEMDQAERLLMQQKKRIADMPLSYANWTLNRLGILQFQEGRYRDALDTFDHNLKVGRALANPRLLAKILNNKGEALEKLGDLPAALASYESSLEMKLDQRDPSAEETLKRLVRVQPGDGSYLAKIQRFTTRLEQNQGEESKANQ